MGLSKIQKRFFFIWTFWEHLSRSGIKCFKSVKNSWFKRKIQCDLLKKNQFTSQKGYFSTFWHKIQFLIGMPQNTKKWFSYRVLNFFDNPNLNKASSTLEITEAQCKYSETFPFRISSSMNELLVHPIVVFISIIFSVYETVL